MGSLESTQEARVIVISVSGVSYCIVSIVFVIKKKKKKEARVARGVAESNSYASFVLSKLLRASYLDERTLTYEPIVNYNIASKFV